MPTSYDQLLDATIEHLHRLKEKGVRHLSVDRANLASLVAPAPPGRAPVRTTVPPKAPVAPPAEATRPVHDSDSIRMAPAPTQSAEIIPTSPAPDPRAKAAALQELRDRALVCVQCSNLASSRTNVVFGVGDIHASLMFVGEAPGADEDRQGEPFVGAAGQLLTRIIQTMGLTRQTVYIANILKCRPDTPGQSSGNRKPTAEEMKTCLPYLQSQIDIIQPKALVALGATAVEGLLGKTEGISRLRGKWQAYRGIPLMPTFHPSYLLRNQALSEKRKVWEDMLAVMEKLGMEISEKQRGYFLKG